MIQLQRAALRVSLAGVLIVVGAAFAPPMSAPEAMKRGPALTTIGAVAAQLGVKVGNRANEEFSLGVQFTGSLVEPAKLAALGIEGMHPGARVIAARIAPELVYLEADELEPPRRASTHIRIDATGKLIQPRKKDAPAPAERPVGSGT